MPTGSERLSASMVAGRISLREAIGRRSSPSARIFIGPEIWSSGSSIGSSTVAVLQPATTSSRPTTLHSSILRRSGYGFALMSSRPSSVGNTSKLRFLPPFSAAPHALRRRHWTIANRRPPALVTLFRNWGGFSNRSAFRNRLRNNQLRRLHASASSAPTAAPTRGLAKLAPLQWTASFSASPILPN
jgi:hypothetical protein